MMCWVAFDRAARAVDQLGLDGPVDAWRAIASEIHAEVCENAWDPHRETFTQSYGSRSLDAALLTNPKVGFLPTSDPRVTGTIAAVERELTTDGFVYRYGPEGSSSNDGLRGQEGVFLLCSFWLADAWAMTGRTSDAHALLTRMIDLANDVGLLAEQYDPASKRMLGNFPQAFSHVGLVNSALSLARAAPIERRQKE
jgi:GH15 family glucan-1,4-alpha-glucosidase